jgi:transposase
MPARSDQLPTNPDTLRALLLAERERHADELAAARGEVERLVAIIKELQRHRFGRRAERLDADQLALALEDLEQTLAAAEAAEEKDETKPTRLPRKRRNNRGALPPHLPREEITVDVDDKTCPCCGGLKHRIGEDVSERLDVTPAQFKVLVLHRPKYACRACEGEVSQAPAPERLIENGIPTEALVAHVIVAKYADHLPLYRQAQIYARQGINLDRSTLADWVGRAAFALRPVYARLFEGLKSSTKLFADETTAPVLDPGRGRTKTGQLWAYARDDRPWCGPEPPGVAYVYAPDRKHERPVVHLAGFKGTLQVDGYGAYTSLAERGDVVLAFCWSQYLEPGFILSSKAWGLTCGGNHSETIQDKKQEIKVTAGTPGDLAWVSTAWPGRARCRHASRKFAGRRASSSSSSRGIGRLLPGSRGRDSREWSPDPSRTATAPRRSCASKRVE